MTHWHHPLIITPVEGYTKLFGSLVHSTIWREPDHVRLVWITMLAMANKDGCVFASLPGLADASRKTIGETKDALAALMAPDAYSRTPDNEGRRIAEIDGGWLLLNHGKYRELMNTDSRREYLKIKKRESRERQRNGEPPRRSNYRVDGQQLSSKSTHAKATSEAKADNDVERREESPNQAELTDSLEMEISEEDEGAGEPGQSQGNRPSSELEALMYAKTLGDKAPPPECVQSWHDDRERAGWSYQRAGVTYRIESWQADLRVYFRHWTQWQERDRQRRENPQPERRPANAPRPPAPTPAWVHERNIKNLQSELESVESYRPGAWGNLPPDKAQEHKEISAKIKAEKNLLKAAKAREAGGA